MGNVLIVGKVNLSIILIMPIMGNTLVGIKISGSSYPFEIRVKLVDRFIFIQ